MTPLTDDIAALCRVLQADEKQLGNDLLAQCLWEAAAEIERLRAIIAEYERPVRIQPVHSVPIRRWT